MTLRIITLKNIFSYYCTLGIYENYFQWTLLVSTIRILVTTDYTKEMHK